MGLSLNGRPTRYGFGYANDHYYPGRKRYNSRMDFPASSKHRWWHLTQDTFTKLAFLPRFLVFLVAAIMLLSSFILSSVYVNSYSNLNAPTIELQVQQVTNHADIDVEKPNTKNNIDFNTSTAVSSCKWAQYADWPYQTEFTGLLSPYRRKLLYVKTPKSSSSTTAHVLQRYTSREGLVVGYPNFAGNEWTFKSERSLHDALMRQKVSEFDALVSHIIYRKSVLENILGAKRPFRVTSVRDPLKRSWSMYMHGISKVAARKFALGASTPLEFAHRLDKDGQLNYAAGYRYGVEPPTVENVDAHYDHVVVSERVPESFVTLAPKLGLRASDLLFFSQKRHGFAKKFARNGTLDDIVRHKTVKDHAWHALANRRLDAELHALPDKIRGILTDLPKMMLEVAQQCRAIHPEDNSCLTKNEQRWDGNQMCLARCIERWAQSNIMCK